MTELLRRRRALMSVGGGSPTPSEWDSAWEYTDGMPTVAGWERTTTGGTCSLGTNGLTLRKNSFDKDVPIKNGVIEAKFVIINERSTMAENRAWLRIGDASNAVFVIFKSYSSSNHIRLYDNSSQQNGTDLGTFALGGEYIVRIEINGATGSVAINGTVIKEDIDTTGMMHKGSLKFGVESQYGGSIWNYVKYKKVS